MPTRTISITDEAYMRLSLLKDEGDSFSEVITKLTGKIDLLDFAGVLSETETKHMEKRIKENRKNSKDRTEHIRREIQHVA